jgi:hypothetical protein
MIRKFLLATVAAMMVSMTFCGTLGLMVGGHAFAAVA